MLANFRSNAFAMLPRQRQNINETIFMVTRICTDNNDNKMITMVITMVTYLHQNFHNGKTMVRK